MKMMQRLLSLLIVLALVCSTLPAGKAEAAEVPQGNYLTLDAAAQQLKQHMLDRNPLPITQNVYIEDERALGEKQLWELFQGIVFQHTGVPTEGDYLRYSTDSFFPYAEAHVRKGNQHWFTLTTSFWYHETAEEEKVITAKVREILDSLNLDGKSDYEKILAIYSYVCDNIEYDYDSVPDPSVMGVIESNSAYAAIVDQKATCGGYAIALYRLLLEAGIDNRMECVYGSINVETGEHIAGHAWNKVKLGDQYYYLDSTWDAGMDTTDYRWFLTGSADFLCDYHYGSEEQATKKFSQQFPMSPISYGKPAAATGSGSCGAKASWSLTEDGTLTISGRGAIRDTVKGLSLWTDVNMYVKNVVIQEGITTIGEFAFWNCPQLISVSIPSTVTKIGKYAFEGCTQLKELTVPDSVTEIGDAAFNTCAALESVRLPNGLSTIQKYTFNYCYGLQSLTIPASVTTIEENAFANAFDPDADVTLVVPETVTQVANLAFAWSNVKAVIWNASIEEPTDGIFYSCKKLESVQLNDSIKRIGARTFTDCCSLKTVNLPAGLEEIVDEEWTVASPGLFMGCYSLESITIPEGVTNIPHSTFSDCISLTQIELHDGITEIGPLAFHNTGITEIVIPASVEKIGHWAFGWSKLKTITFQGDAPAPYENKPESGLFPGCGQEIELYHHDGSTWTEEALARLRGDAWLFLVSAHGENAPHTLEDFWQVAEDKHWRRCTGCTYREEADHRYKTNCESFCEVCGYWREVAHDYHWETTPAGHKKLCASCGCIDRDTNHYFDDKGICTECGYDRNEFSQFQGNQTALWIFLGFIAAGVTVFLVTRKKKNNK